jgi:hypothetical protein
MLKHLVGSTFALAFLLTGCGGGGSDPAPGGGNPPPAVPFAQALQEAADCAGLSLEDADDLIRVFADLVNSINTNSNVGSITWVDPTFGATVDLDGDGQNEAISGTVTPLGGATLPPFSDGDMVQVQWSIQGNTLTGMGNFELERLTNGLVRITQAGNLIESGDCELSLTNLNLTFNPAVPGGDLQATGTIGFTLTTSSDTLTGTVTFTNASTAQIDATFRSVGVSLTVDLTTFQVTIL